MFARSIVSILVFGCLIILCYEYGKLQQIMTYFVTTTPVEAIDNFNTNCQCENMYLHIFYVVLLLVALYCLAVLLKKLYNYFTTYNTVLNFHRDHGLATGPWTDIVITFCNLRHEWLVQVQTPIPLLTIMNDSAYPSFNIKPGHGLN